MSVFYCHDCDRYVDSDYSPCWNWPPESFELICDDCAAERGLE